MEPDREPPYYPASPESYPPIRWQARPRSRRLILVSLDGRVFMEMVLVDVVSRGTGGLPCALLGDILWLSRVGRTQ